jgi:tRNA (guanine37-N1)-methyltransferase
MFRGPFDESIIKRALERGLVSVFLHNIRDYATDKHHIVDDYPYGGGAGMVMKPEPVFAAVEAVKAEVQQANPQIASFPIILLTPQGRLFNQRIANELATQEQLIFICGHYEGVDERVVEQLVTDEISIGDYILTGGELAAMVIVDAVVRRLPGVLGSESATAEESHTRGLLEYPQYTRPAVYRGRPVPEVLLSGNHAEIARWRRAQSIRRTLLRRPDLLEKADLTEGERKTVELEKSRSS